MSGNYRDSSHRSPFPFEYCTCRCNAHFGQYSSFSRSYSAHMTNTTHTTTSHSYNTHYNRDLAHTLGDSSKLGNVDLGDSSYVNAASKNIYNGAYAINAHTSAGAAPGSFDVKHKESDFSDEAYKNDLHGSSDAAGANTDGERELISKFKSLYTSKSHHERDSPVLSDGTDFTHGESAVESGEYLERLHCASCDKPLLIYSSLDFKLFDNWVNYVFYHKSFSPSLHPSVSHEHPHAQADSSDDNFADAAEHLPENAITERAASCRDDMDMSAMNSDTDRSALDHTALSHAKDGMDGDATDGNYDHKFGVGPENSMQGFEDPRYVPVTYENEDLRSIADITGSILMSSEETLFSVINSISPGDQCTNEKNQLFDSVKRFLQYCLGEDTIVHLTGSTAYDIDIDYSEGVTAQCNSDLDIVLLSNAFGGDPRVILHKVYNELSNMQHVLKERNKCPIWVLADSNIKLVESAKVPIVIIETKNGLLCDISVNTLYPLLHTELFKSYIDEHPMVRPLMRIIKHWLLVRGIPSMKEGGFPSILWMSLFCNALDASIVNASSNLELLSYQFGAQSSVDGLSVTHADNMGANSVDNSVADASVHEAESAESLTVNKADSGLDEHRHYGEGSLSNPDQDNYSVKSSQHSDHASATQAVAAAHRMKSPAFNTANYNYAAAVISGMNHANAAPPQSTIQHSNSQLSIQSSNDGGTFEDFDYKDEDDEDDDDYDELNLSETYREMFISDWMGVCTIGQLWERMQGVRGDFGILCSLEKCFMNLSRGISLMDIISRFPHIKSGSDYGGMSLFCKNIIRLIEMEPNVPYGTWLVYYYELNRASEYMTLYSKRLEILVTLLVFLRLLCNNSNSLDDLKSLASGIHQSFGYDLSHLWDGTQTTLEYNSLYVNNQYNLNMSMGAESSELNTSTSVVGSSPKLVVSSASHLSAQASADLRMAISTNPGFTSMDSTMSGSYASKVIGSDANSKPDPDPTPVEPTDLMSILDPYLTNVALLFRIQLRCEEPETSIKLLIYHMFQQFKSIPNVIFERVQDNVYSIPVAIEPPSPIEEDLEYGHRVECGMWDDSGWYIVVLQEKLCIVKVIKICIEWDFWWSKDFVSRRDTRSIFHGFTYRQLRLDFYIPNDYYYVPTSSINSPSVLVKRGNLVLFNPCDIVSKLHVLKVVKHEQYISPSLYSTDFYTGVKCLYVLPGFEVDRFMCFEQIAHKLKHYVEFRPSVTYCKLCGIINMKKINTYTENKIPQRKLRNAKYVLCNQKYNHIYDLMQYKHSK